MTSSAMADRGLDPMDTATVLEHQSHVLSDDDTGDVDGPETAALLAEVLTLDESPIEDTLDVLPPADFVDALPREADQGSRCPGRSSPWFDARFQLVHDGTDPATTTTVLQAAFHHVEAVHRGATLAEVAMDIKRALSLYAPSCGRPAPDNPACRYPPSYYLCKVICDVGDLAEAEVHMCSNGDCPHMTAFPPMERAALLHHVRNCTSASCTLCRCKCGGFRMMSDGPGSSLRPCAPCYFFPDVFQQYFLDQQWYHTASSAVRLRQGNFYTCPEGKRILTTFADAGVPADEVWPLANSSFAITACAFLRFHRPIAAAPMLHPIMPHGTFPS